MEIIGQICHANLDAGMRAVDANIVLLAEHRGSKID